MRDLIRDWKKWSHGERMLAAVLSVLMVAMPLGLLMTGTVGVYASTVSRPL